MATFVQRKGGWQVRIRRKGAPAISRSFDLLVDAQRWARELEREHDLGNIAALRDDAARTLIFDVADAYMRTVVPHKRDHSAAGHVQAASGKFGAYAIGRVRNIDVAAWRDELLADGFSPQSVIHRLHALSALFTYAEREMSIALPACNPVKAIRKPPKPRARDRRLRPGELDALMRAAAAPGAATGLPQIITLAIETSMRLGELIGLEWSRVDLKRRTAHLVDTKNGESRTVALSTAAIEAFKALPRRIDGRVFPWKTVSGFEAIWQRCIKRARREHVDRLLLAKLQAAGLDAQAELRALVYKKREASPRAVNLLAKLEREDTMLVNLRFHDLRHEATSRLFEKGLGIMEVASMTGHKSLAMLKRYTHVEAERLAAKLG